jgi:signal transduction histidine kinase
LTRSKNKRKIGIKQKTFLYFALFGILVLALLWTSQIFLLDDFYYMLLGRSLEKNADKISSSLFSEIQSVCDTIASEDGICISVYNSAGTRIAYSDTQYNCLLHHVDASAINGFYSSALESGGENLSRVTLHSSISQSSGNAPERAVYTRLGRTSDGIRVIIMLDSAVAPVGGVIDTLTVQLCFITAIALFLALIIAAVIANKISSPIEKINESAKELAKGNYSAEFDGGELKEISELADTLNYASLELSKLDRLQKELIANISHDLRTPLTMIIGYSEMIKDLPGENTPENIDVIIKESKRLSLLVNDLIEISKYQSKAVELKPEIISINSLVSETVDRFSKLTEHDGYKIKLSLEQDANVSADKNHLLQVLYNLLQNAINYCGDDKTVEVNVKNTGKNVRVEIIDHGAGIPQDKLPYIWDRYYKIDSVHRRGVGGSGIGLSIVKQILEMHHASYGVQSDEGMGSCFYFELPCEK